MMLDPVAQMREKEEQERLPFIAPLVFRTDYDPQPDGSVKEFDYVEWVKKGTQNPPVIGCKVSRMPKFYPLEWQVLEPSYKRWKENQSAPVDGTPLAAWPGATPQLVKALEPLNIRSVEDLTRMEDSAVMRIAIPGLRAKIALAKAFLEAQSHTAGVSSEIVKLRAENEFLKSEIADMRQMIGERSDKPAEPAPKRRGRPPKLAIAS